MVVVQYCSRVCGGRHLEGWLAGCRFVALGSDVADGRIEVTRAAAMEWEETRARAEFIAVALNELKTGGGCVGEYCQRTLSGYDRHRRHSVG